MTAARTRYSALAKVERVREIAFNAYIDGMHFHEVAIRDPFEAEREYQALASRITELLGPPKGVRVVKLPDSPSAAKPSLCERWRENRIGPYFHRDFRFGWLGNGWNAVRLGWMTFYLGSGPSPLARLRSRLGR